MPGYTTRHQPVSCITPTQLTGPLFYFFMVHSNNLLHLQLDLESGLFIHVFPPNSLVYIF